MQDEGGVASCGLIFIIFSQYSLFISKCVFGETNCHIIYKHRVFIFFFIWSDINSLDDVLLTLLINNNLNQHVNLSLIQLEI